MRRSKKLLLTLLALLCLCPAGFSIEKQAKKVETKTDYFRQGVALVMAQRYEEGASCLKQATSDNPKDAIAHYYLAIALVHTGKSADARQEFFVCYCLDPKGPASRYSQTALGNYAITNKPSDCPAAIKDPSFDKTISLIREQAEREKNRKAQTAEALSQDAASNAESEVFRIKNATAGALGVTPYAGLSDKYKSPTEPSSALGQAEERMKIARMTAKQDARDYRNWSSGEAKKIEDVASNLESQLKTSHFPGRSLLKPQGTGFYVRYYGTIDANKRIPEVHPAVARFIDSSAASESDRDLSEESKGLSNPEKSVTGSVVRDRKPVAEKTNKASSN
jgi:tetratricopeptide (TPR) repeat protein